MQNAFCAFSIKSFPHYQRFRFQPLSVIFQLKTRQLMHSMLRYLDPSIFAFIKRNLLTLSLESRGCWPYPSRRYPSPLRLCFVWCEFFVVTSPLSLAPSIVNGYVYNFSIIDKYGEICLWYLGKQYGSFCKTFQMAYFTEGDANTLESLSENNQTKKS